MIQAHILKLPTPRLLAYYKKHYRRDNPHTDHTGYPETGMEDACNEWSKDQEALKAELAKREHVE